MPTPPYTPDCGTDYARSGIDRIVDHVLHHLEENIGWLVTAVQTAVQNTYAATAHRFQYVLAHLPAELPASLILRIPKWSKSQVLVASLGILALGFFVRNWDHAIAYVSAIPYSSNYYAQKLASKIVRAGGSLMLIRVLRRIAVWKKRR